MASSKPTEIGSSKMFEGFNKRYKHDSPTLGCSMNFHIYFPPSTSPDQRFPVLYWLSGLTCNDENFIIKSGAQRVASTEGIALIVPDTSPRGLNVEGEADSYDFGVGAGFYLNATVDKWKNWQMYDYIVKELPKVLSDNFPQLDTSRASISGHSMGGHGALTIYLKNLDKYKSVSAFAPIVNPINCPWGQKAFTNYLGDDKTAWEEYDATCLIKKFNDVAATIMIDQGDDDKFLHENQLLPSKFDEACRNVKAPLLLRMQPGYDHSYYFIATFIDDHIRHHAQALNPQAFFPTTSTFKGITMTTDTDMSSWTDLLHSSSKLVEQAAPSAQFPPLQRNLDQLEALSKKLKSKTLRTEALFQSIAATRLLAREGINAEQLARDLKSFELKTTFEDVFPAEATSVEEYLQQVREMAMVSAVQEAQKDNLRNFSDYMMTVLEDDWQKEKRDFLHSLSRISTLPRTNITDSSIGANRSGPILSLTSSPHISSGPSNMELLAIADKPAIDKKAAAYAEVVRNLNDARQRGLAFKPATAFKSAYDSLALDSSGGKSVTMNKIWHLIQSLTGENLNLPRNVSKKMSLIIGARRHLEWGHDKYIMEMIHSHPAQAALGGVVGNLPKIHAFLRIRLRDYGVLDFDAGDARRQPPVDTTWQQIYFCLRTGYYDEAREVASRSRVSHQFASQLTEWISNGGMVSPETASIASEECEKMLRITDRTTRSTFDKKKLLLYSLISGSRRQLDRLLREHPTLFTTIEDFLWFKLSAIRDPPTTPPTLPYYTLPDLQSYLNKFEPSYYTKNGKDPLVYPYILLLSIQLNPAVIHLSKDVSEDGYNIDAAHIAIALADHGVLDDVAVAESASVVRQYGGVYLRCNDVGTALEYYVQAAAAVGGGEVGWSGRGSVDQERQRGVMLKQLLMEVVVRDGGVGLLLGGRGDGEEGELGRVLGDGKVRVQFLVEAARYCLEAGLNDKSIEIQKRIGAFSAALDTINKSLSEAICSLSRGRLDGESRTAGLLHSANDLLETFKYSPNVSLYERERVLEQETILRQLETILSIHKLSRQEHYLDALREVAKLPFLPFDPRSLDTSADTFQNLSPHVQACVPDLLKVALQSIDNVRDADGSLRALRIKIANFLANNLNRNWPRDLYERVARSL